MQVEDPILLDATRRAPKDHSFPGYLVGLLVGMFGLFAAFATGGFRLPLILALSLVLATALAAGLLTARRFAQVERNRQSSEAEAKRASQEQETQKQLAELRWVEKLRKKSARDQEPPRQA